MIPRRPPRLRFLLILLAYLVAYLCANIAACTVWFRQRPRPSTPRRTRPPAP